MKLKKRLNDFKQHLAGYLPPSMNTLFTRLFVRFFLLSLLIIIILGFSMIYFFYNFQFSKTETEIIQNSQVLNQALYNSINENDEESISNTLQLIAEINSGQAWLIDEQGFLIHSYPYLDTGGSSIQFLNSEPIFAGNIISQEVDPQHFERPMLLVGMPVRQVDEVVGGLLVFTSVEGINSTVRQVRRLMLYSSFIAIVLGVVLAYGWSRSLASPLKNMSKAVLNLRRGDYGLQLDFQDENPSRELSTLRDSFNSLSTELKHSIDELTRERNKLKYILTGMEEGVLAIDRNKNVILHNSSFKKLFNISQEVVDNNISEIGLEEQVRQTFDKVLTEQEANQQEFTIDNSKQEKRILLRCNAICVGDSIWGVVGLFQDISERWRFEKLQQDFVANVSHELKAPLSSIRGSAEILLDDIVDDQEKREEYLEIVLQESNRLGTLVDEILSMAEYESQDISGEKEIISVADLLRNVVDTFNKSGSLRGRIQVDYPEEELLIEANNSRIKQVLFNFLDNARKFSPEDSSIYLSAAAVDGRVKFTVRDEGIGIPTSELDNIWERFYKVDKARTPGKEGSGLGLAISREIILEHDGDVFVESSEGEGTTIGFYLPRANK